MADWNEKTATRAAYAVGAVMCCGATLPWRVCDVWRLEVVLYVLEMLEGMRSVLLCMLEAVGGELYSLEVREVREVMRCVLLCTLEDVEGGLCLLEVSDVMRCVLLCMPEAVEGRL